MATLLVELIAPVVAALLAIGGYLLRQRYEDRRDRERTLDSIRILILTSRAFTRPEEHHIPSSDDVRECRDAVRRLREFAQDSVVDLHVRADRSAVTRIVSACNSYLEEVEAQPEDHPQQLVLLRRRLQAALDSFSDADHTVDRTNEPGALAFAERD